MIVKNTTSTVNFFVADSDGLPATGKASSITATITMNGDSTSTTISEPISEIHSTEQPGWYRFNYPFSTAGNAFITFTCTGCKIMPWEEQVVEMSGSTDSLLPVLNAIKAGMLNWAVSGNTLTIKSDTNSVLGTYTLTRDTDGNIIKVAPNS